ncbi:MAG: CTP synthase, partial [Candidatus Bathyarchaeota archaeon]|nr:CTP synthase [Candidatus Bathyarchaeum sp.]
FLDANMPKDNNITTGQIYQTVIDRERRGDFLGKCVQIIPHVTDEIKRRTRVVAEKSKADVVLTELGGTVGDIEGLPFLEAIRQMRLEEGFDNTLYVHLALVPILDVTGEMKTKPLQHSVNELRRIGIQPDTVVARCRKMIDEETLRKVALFGTIPQEAVFCSFNVPSIYQVPLILDKQGMGDYICNRLGISKNPPEWKEWQQFVDCFENPQHEVKIALIGKYAGLTDSYVSMNEAFRHSGAKCQAKVTVNYIEAECLENNAENLKLLEGHDGIFIPYGFGPRGTEGKIKGIQYARENNIPFLGVCYGFQLAVIEFARNVLGFKGANSTEINPETLYPVIDLMPEQKTVNNKGGTMRLGAHEVRVIKDTMAYTLYGKDTIFERHRHRWEVNPEYWTQLEQKGLRFSGNSPDARRKEILELPRNFFFFASQFHGEFKSRPTKPEPEYYGFIKACLDKKLGKIKPEF